MTIEPTNSANSGFSVVAGSKKPGATALEALPTLRMNFSQAQLDLLQQAYDSLGESLYAAWRCRTIRCTATTATTSHLGQGGNDMLHGVAGADIYVFGRGYGHDTIVNTGETLPVPSNGAWSKRTAANDTSRAQAA